MMESMKRSLFALFLLGSAGLATAADLAGVRTVYILPMGSALDQYLASRLTTERVFEVVTDPKQADAVFTERIGEGLQAQLETLIPPPPPPTPPPPPVEEAPKDVSRRQEEPVRPMSFEAVNKLENPAMYSTFGRGKGTIFLVDVKTRRVLWSVFESPKGNSSNKDWDRTASDIVGRLKKDLAPKK